MRKRSESKTLRDANRTLYAGAAVALFAMALLLAEANGALILPDVLRDAREMVLSTGAVSAGLGWLFRKRRLETTEPIER